MFKKTLLLTSAFLISLVSSSQITFEENPSNITGIENLQNGSVEFADIDGDNDEDLLITGVNNSFTNKANLYRNNGSGEFTLETGTPFAGVNSSSTAFVDIDGDGDQDVFIIGRNGSPGKERASFALYKNDGGGNFTMASHPFEVLNSASFAFADIDGDNDLDLIISGGGDRSNSANLYENDGNGNFSQRTSTPLQGLTNGAIAFADIDGDNDLDLIMAGVTGRTNYTRQYTNDGSGNFSLIPSTPFEGVSDRPVLLFEDIDTDGDLDLLLTGLNNSGNPISKIYNNNGSGTFSLNTNISLEGMYRGNAAFIDVDGDGDKDLLTAGNPNSRLYENSGDDNFSLVTISLEFLDGISFDFSDVDADNDPDFLVNGGNNSYDPISTLYKNTTITCSLANQNITSFTTSVCLGNSIKVELENSEVGAKYAIYNSSDIRVSEFFNGTDSPLQLTSSDSITKNGMYYVLAEDENKSTCQQLIGDAQNLNIITETEVIETSITSCASVEWRGKTYDTTGDYKEKVKTEEGCYILYRLNLTITPLVASISLEGNTLAGATSFGTYQWLDCDNNFAPIEGATLRKFAPTESGNYALQIDKDGCRDTSACLPVTITGVNETISGNEIALYPNPIKEKVNISFGEELSEITIEVKDVIGKLVQRNTYYNQTQVSFNLNQPKGIYTVQLSSPNNIKRVWRVMKQ